MRFAIEGQIESVGAADIFLFLSQTHRTSVVAFERPDQETRVFFVDGLPVWGLSSKAQLQLEARLAMGGALKLREIEAALASQNAGANRIPQTLISLRMVTEAGIEKELEAVSLDVLRDLATWTSGAFTVYDGVTPPPWAHTVTPDFFALLVEGLRGQCQKEELHKQFGSRRAILRARATSRDTTCLNDTERAILGLANGERTVEDIIRQSGLDEQQTLAAMHVLCALRLTDLLPPVRGVKPGTARVALGAAPAPAPPAPPPPSPAPAPSPAHGVAAEKPGPFTEPPPPQVEARKPSPPAAPRAPEPAFRTADSTARIPLVPEVAIPRAPSRSLSITSDDKTENVVLTATTFAIGRHPRNDLVLKDPRISSFHCRIEMEGTKYVIRDLRSRNGTLLNSTRIDQAILRHNDQIQLGSTKVVYLET